MKKLFVLLLLTFATGCAHITESGYYWGNYSESYYQYIKSPSAESQTNHLQTLQDILTVSAEKGLKVPPGIYAELGYIYAKKGEIKKANAMFSQEVKLYPESSKFVQGLMHKEDA